jgi:two-component system CheB/CheR fusion protein
MASHELKTPMTSLKGYLQLIEMQGGLSKNIALYLQKANTSFTKLQHLVNDLLDVSKIKAGKLAFDLELLDLSDLVYTCIESSSHIYPSFKIKKDIQKELYIMGNAERLEQVMMNLVNNAVKYSLQSKEIIIRVAKNYHEASVSVTDFGIGMSATDQKRIFERFYRAENNKLSTPGLGMGLYISSEIIKEHKGKLSVKSKLKEGAEFSFSIPLVEKK